MRPRLRRTIVRNAALLAGALFALASPAFAQSLCAGNETVVFTCQAKEKTVSVCASNDLSAHGGYLQFRIGTARSQVSYPASRARTSNTGTFGYAYVGQGPEGHHLLLNDGKDIYGIISTDDRGPQYGDEETAFVHQQGSTIIDSAVCDKLTDPTDAGLDLLEKAGFENTHSDVLVLP